MIITIDGPAGTGKTTVAKGVAKSLQFTYFDTGAMYRAVTWQILQKKIPLENRSAISQLLDAFAFTIQSDEHQTRYFVGDIEVTDAIRSSEVTAYVSAVSALPPVREALWKIQRRFAEKGDVVFEGRDLGTVVFPDAEVKIFLTGRPEVRAQRRLLEMQQKNPTEINGDIDAMVAALMRRDELDSTRALAPLKCAEDAHVIDTSDLSISEVIDLILQCVHK